MAALLAYEHSLVHANDLRRLNAAFFTVNGYISLLFLLFWSAAVAVARSGAAVAAARMPANEALREIGESSDRGTSTKEKPVTHPNPGTANGAAELVIDDARLRPIADKVLAGERLNFDDGITLYRSADLLAVGWLANYVREQRHGNVCYFNVNRHINPTNVCVAHCKLCAFGRSPEAPGAYTFALEEIWQRAEAGRARRRHRVPHGGGPASRTCPLNIFWI